MQQTVVGVVGVTPPPKAAAPEGAHWPPVGVTEAVTLRAVAARFPLHVPTAVLAKAAGDAQSVVAETDTPSMVQVVPVAAPHAQDPTPQVRVSLAPAK